MASTLLISHAIASVTCCFALMVESDIKVRYANLDMYFSLVMSMIAFLMLDRLIMHLFDYLNKPSAKELESVLKFLSLNVAAKNVFKTNNLLFVPAEVLECKNNAPCAVPRAESDKAPTKMAESDKDGDDSLSGTV